MKNFKYLTVLAFLAFASTIFAAETHRRHASSHKRSRRQDNNIEYYKVWSNAPHNAFTGLTIFKGNFYLICREGAEHASNDGAIRVLKSSDGKKFNSVAHFNNPEFDLRDPKILNLGDTLLYIQYCMADRDKKIIRNGMNWSTNGSNWSDTKVYSEKDSWWLWSAHNMNGEILSVGYDFFRNYNNALYLARRPGEYGGEVGRIATTTGACGEASLESKGDTVFCAIRATQHSLPGFLGYTIKGQWTNWKVFVQDPKLILGGPKLFFLPNGKLYLITRSFKGPNLETVIFLVDRSSFTLSEALVLPDAGDRSGDNGYAGIAYDKNTLYVSYYLTVNKKAQVYIAKIPLSKFN